MATLDAEQAVIRQRTLEENARLIAPEPRGDEEALEVPVATEVHTIQTKKEDGKQMKEAELQKEWIRKRQEMSKSPLSAFVGSPSCLFSLGS